MSVLLKVAYQPSYVIARRLGISPRSLGRVTGSVFVRAGDKKYDIGLCIKIAPKGLCVPDYVRPQPDDKGWTYSEDLTQALMKYKVSAEASGKVQYLGAKATAKVQSHAHEVQDTHP